jgi:IPT/TIG domain
MLRRLIMGLSVPAMALLGMLAIGGGHAGAAPEEISLVVPQGTAFSVLKYDCGGIKELAYVTGFDYTFDPSAGYPTGYVYLTTTCSAGKGTDFTVDAWTADTWDLTGALLSYSVATPNPSPPSPLSTTDSLTGNQIYDSASPCPGLGGTGSTAYACLEWASTFTPRPKVTSISPVIGPAMGGTSVTISGDGFTAATAVDFGSTSAAFTVNSDTSITAVSPVDTSGTSPDTLDVTVVSPGGTSFTSSSDQFNSYVQPTITVVNPNSGAVSGGYYVTVTGTNFIGTTSVNVGDTVTAFQVLDNNTLSVYIPGSDSGPGDSTSISVTSPGGTSPNTPADQFTYNAPAPSYSITCSKLAVNVTYNTSSVSLCTWSGQTLGWSAAYKVAKGSATVPTDGGTFKWGTSKGTTTISAPALTSLGPGSCKQTTLVTATEEQVNGTVTGVTSPTLKGGYVNPTSTNDEYQATICVFSNGKIAQAPGTKVYM